MSDTTIKPEPTQGVKIRVNNQMYKCSVDDKFYNGGETQAYAVGLMLSVEPMKQQVQGGKQEWAIALGGAIICEPCYNNMKFKEPSAIAKAVADIKTDRIKI